LVTALCVKRVITSLNASCSLCDLSHSGQVQEFSNLAENHVPEKYSTDPSSEVCMTSEGQGSGPIHSTSSKGIRKPLNYTGRSCSARIALDICRIKSMSSTTSTKSSRKSSKTRNHRSTLSLQKTEIIINVYDLLPVCPPPRTF
jgi:hypothetical protein